jgi:hypothetical protein
MADMYVQASLAFRCAQNEWALIDEANRASASLMRAHDCKGPSTAFLRAFPPSKAHDLWSGYRDIFADGDYPDLGADIIGRPLLDAVGKWDGGWEIAIMGMAGFQPDAIAQLIYVCCKASLAAEPVGFEWAFSCSKPRLGEFGGGWCAIFPDRIEMKSTSQALEAALNGGIL